MICVDRRTFQLYLLSTMRAQARVTQALSELAASSADLARANDQVRAVLGTGVPKSDAYLRILGDPDERSVKGTSVLLRFSLPLWPHFEFALDIAPDGYVERAELARARGAATPSLLTTSDLSSWAYVSEEITAKFGAPRLEDGWSDYRDYLYQIPSTDGRPATYRLCFDFNLLQTLAPV